METPLILIIFILSIVLPLNSHVQPPFVSGTESHLIHFLNLDVHSDLPDAYRGPCQLIESRNFICDEHFVTTADDYILSIQHIIHPEFEAKNRSIGKPIILQHGLLGSATHWLINSDGGFAADWTGDVSDVNLTTEGRNLPYLLANLGYDVWLTNLRGCRFSRNHTYLDPNKDESFWKFSYDQMIKYDAPLFIDYVLNQTGHSQLGWIGHSMGTMVILGLLSERPEYSAKLKPFIAMAPIAHVDHINTPIRKIADLPALKAALTYKGGEINVYKSLLDLFSHELCSLPLFNAICASPFFIFGGYDPDQFNKTRIPVYINGGFCGTSVWTLVHFAYNVHGDQFAKFNYGVFGNIERYGSKDPPKYNLSAITLENIVFVSSLYDALSDPEDVVALKNALKIPYIEYFASYPKFSHLDFILAENVYDQINKQVVTFLGQFN